MIIEGPRPFPDRIETFIINVNQEDVGMDLNGFPGAEKTVEEEIFGPRKHAGIKNKYHGGDQKQTEQKLRLVKPPFFGPAAACAREQFFFGFVKIHGTISRFSGPRLPRSSGTGSIKVSEFNHGIPFFSLTPLFPSSTAQPTMSPHTLTTVRHISSGRSIASRKPIPSTGRPTAVRTSASVTRPALGIAAAPIAASDAVKKIISCCARPISIPKACAIKRHAVASYIAVTSMFTVAPMGSTNPEISFETPAFFSTHSNVTGNVAEEEDVENADSRAGCTALKYAQ